MKTDGLASAAAALRYWERRQETLSNNLANADTAGFKAERVFGRLLESGVTVPDTATDTRTGRLTTTNGPLDLAIDGPGFFVVNTPAGERLSRGGAFTLDAEGYIADQSGNRLLGSKGPIQADGGKVSIDRGGAVNIDGEVVDQLRLETTPPGSKLDHAGQSLFVPGATRLPLSTDGGPVHQGAIEESNVNTVSTMVDMIAVQRAYAAAEKAISVLDGVHGTISNELAKSA